MSVAAALAAVASVTVRRLRSGPRYAGWTWRYEVVNDFLLRMMLRLSRRPFAAQRRGWDRLARQSPLLDRFRRERVDAGGVPADWFQPLKASPDAPTLLYLHGGGFVHGSIRTHHDVALRLAQAAGAQLLMPELRLAPEHRHPAQIEDALAAFRWLLGAGIPADRIVVAGDSSGGNLALALLLALRDRGGPLPAGGVVICPWVDLDERGGSMIEHARIDWAEPHLFDAWADAYLGDAPRSAPLASPLHAPLAGLPPLHVLVGGAEMLRDQVESFAAKARGAGVSVRLEVYPGMTHNWLVLGGVIPGFAPAAQAIASVGGFVSSRMERQAQRRLA